MLTNTRTILTTKKMHVENNTHRFWQQRIHSVRNLPHQNGCIFVLVMWRRGGAGPINYIFQRWYIFGMRADTSSRRTRRGFQVVGARERGYAAADLAAQFMRI